MVRRQPNQPVRSTWASTAAPPESGHPEEGEKLPPRHGVLISALDEEAVMADLATPFTGLELPTTWQVNVVGSCLAGDPVGTIGP